MPEAPNEEDMEPDVLGLLALVLGVAGLLLRNRYFAWGGFASSLMAYVNARSTEADSRQGTGSVSFTLMGLVLIYVQMFTVPVSPK
ncbi:hypothetical protein HK105_209430 [Polyrhizophydium stewartii]|uniref:Uncharacterized protein n=1 Tax=Polyrhizophydium stewartii TaxID=2732419 RepID=A0ABR4MV14_9FUNG|nr:hypothetical protein HK105_007795 [Polyrhizophydium stewartii]